MFYVLSKLLDVFLSPLTWALVLVALAVPWRRRAARRWRRRRALGAIGLAVLVVASLEPVDDAIAWRLEHTTTSTYRPDVVYDAVILLGGVTDERVTAETGQKTYNNNVERLTATYELLRDGKARVAILSGAAMDPNLAAFGEARALATQLREWGIADDRIVVEDKARNTRENAVYAAAIVRARGLSKVVIVTSAFHMPRAIACFEAVGLPVDTLMVDYRTPRSTPLGLARLLPRAHALYGTTESLREIFGLVVYRVVGYGKRR